jgi:hypothetical protein
MRSRADGQLSYNNLPTSIVSWSRGLSSGWIEVGTPGKAASVGIDREGHPTIFE